MIDLCQFGADESNWQEMALLPVYYPLSGLGLDPIQLKMMQAILTFPTLKFRVPCFAGQK